MIDVLFFASVREQLGTARLAIPFTEATRTLDDLVAYLTDQYGQTYADVLRHGQALRAVNQDMVAGNSSLSDGDEVAFFPPVTGG